MKTSLIPTEKSLSDFINETKGLIAKDDTLEAIRFVRNHLPENSPKYDLLILLERRYESVVEDVLKGIVSADDELLEKNKVSNSLMEFLNILKEEDFSASTATPTSANEKDEDKPEEPEVRVGKTLYQIPNKMKVQEEVECKIWIAFDLETILQEVEKSDTDAVRDIRISNVMGVELFVHNNSDAFEISTYDSTEQIIEKGLPTEWTFYVKPLKEGKYPLILRISVIEEINGEKVHKTKVLREVVQIVTETIEPLEEGVETKEAEGLIFATPDSDDNKPKGGAIDGSGSGGTGAGGKKGATGAAGILKAGIMMAMVLFTGYVIQNPSSIGLGGDHPVTASNEIRDWQNASKSMNPDDIEHFTEKYPESEFEALAMGRMEALEKWEDVSMSTDAVIVATYMEKVSETDLKTLASKRLAFLKEWNAIKWSTNPVDFEVFINKKPDEDLERLARKRLVFVMAWLKIKPSTKPDDFRTFINTKPDKDLADLAKKRLKFLTKSPQNDPPTTNNPPREENTQPKIVVQMDTNPQTPSGFLAEYPHPADCDMQESAVLIACTEDLIQKRILQNLTKISDPTGSAVVNFTITKKGVQTKLQVARSGSHAGELDSVVRQTIRNLPKFKVGKKALKQQLKVVYNESKDKWEVTFLK